MRERPQNTMHLTAEELRRKQLEALHSSARDWYGRGVPMEWWIASMLCARGTGSWGSVAHCAEEHPAWLGGIAQAVWAPRDHGPDKNDCMQTHDAFADVS